LEADVPPHRFNPLSALVGLTVVALGAAVAVFGFDELDNDPIIWGAAIAIFVALILVAIPTRSIRPRDENSDPALR
jgi:peptidoglycan/LPS O-acetylase OafA/YrhL